MLGHPCDGRRKSRRLSIKKQISKALKGAVSAMNLQFEMGGKLHLNLFRFHLWNSQSPEEWTEIHLFSWFFGESKKWVEGGEG